MQELCAQIGTKSKRNPWIQETSTFSTRKMYRQDNVTKPEGFHVDDPTQTKIIQNNYKKQLDFRGQDPWVEQDLLQL